MDDLVKVTIFYADVDDFAVINEIYARHMPDPPPARSAPANVQLPRGLLISIDAIAVAPAGGWLVPASVEAVQRGEKESDESDHGGLLAV